MVVRGPTKIGSLWIGGSLSWIEEASIHSFVQTGHDYVLYTYETISNPPKGIEVRDAREIWDTENIVYHSKANSPAIHADIFRVIMVQKTGRVWADTDIIALRPFPEDLQWYIGYERTDRPELGNAILGLPKESKTLEGLNGFLTAEFPVPPWFNPRQRKQLEERRKAGEELDLGAFAWGESGPRALTYFANASGEIEYAQPQSTFFPVTFQERKKLTDPQLSADVNEVIKRENSLCIHLYSRWLRKFTNRLPGQRPVKTSWLGSYLEKEGLVDYQALEKKLQKKVKRKSGNVKPPAIDATEFYSNLEERRKSLPGNVMISPHGRLTAVTMAKDEGPYILEWVAHHHLLGFTDILVYTNDCTDGTSEMFDALHSVGIVSHYDNPELGSKPPQSRALFRAMQHPLVKDADWIMVVDLDEFVSIKHKNGTVNDLIDVIQEKNATAMALTWRFFGSSGFEHYEEKPTTERFCQAADNTFSKGFGVKTLFKNSNKLRLGIHRPKIKKKSVENEVFPLDWINGSGEPVDGKIMTWRQTMQSSGYALAQVNHYGVKSHEEYLMRRLRGDVLNNHDKYDKDYFKRFDRNDIRDDSGLRFQQERDKFVASLRGIDAVREAEKNIQKKYRAKLDNLRASENYPALMAELKSNTKEAS